MSREPSLDEINRVITRARNAIRRLPATINDKRPDNRVQTARMLLHLIDFIKWFMLDRVTRDGWPEDPNTRNPPIKITAVLKRADKLWERLRRAHRAALAGGWEAQPILNCKGFSFPRVMGGSLHAWQHFVQRNILDSLVGAGNAKFCIVHDAWFEKNLMASVALNRSYNQKLLLSDWRALETVVYDV